MAVRRFYDRGPKGKITSDAGVTMVFNNNCAEVLEQLDDAVLRILTSWGLKVEGWAKKLCPVGTVESTGKKGYRGGTLRNSITFDVDAAAETVQIGSNVEYAPYVELGTGPYFEPPPDWETFGTKKGSGLGKGYVHARPFLRPAVEDHKEALARIARNELSR